MNSKVYDVVANAIAKAGYTNALTNPPFYKVIGTEVVIVFTK